MYVLRVTAMKAPPVVVLRAKKFVVGRYERRVYVVVPRVKVFRRPFARTNLRRAADWLAVMLVGRPDCPRTAPLPRSKMMPDWETLLLVSCV